MTPRERAEKWASRVDGILGEPEEGGSPFRNELIRWVEESIQSALAERTEQCAKMIQDFGVSDKWVTWNNPRCGYDCHHGRSMDLLAAEIRALNQPENKS